MLPKPTKRNLRKFHTLALMPGRGKRKVIKYSDEAVRGDVWKRNRRAINPEVGVKLGKEGRAREPASFMFVNKGIEARGAGTRKSRKNRRYKANQKARGMGGK